MTAGRASESGVLPKAALVTGGARGIGRAVCLELASRGYDVAVNCASNVESATDVAERCQEMGVRAVAIKADVGDHAEAKRLVEETVDTLGSLDVLVNNAGITRDNLLVRMTEEEFSEVIRVNLEGTFNCMRHAGKVMMKQRRGSIVNISSVAGVIGNAGQVNYSASKAGIIGMTKSAARELAKRGIRVNAVAPGFIDTDMTKAMPDKAREEMEQLMLLGRLGDPADVAKAVAFLAGDEASYITGQVLCVDGGIAI